MNTLHSRAYSDLARPAFGSRWRACGARVPAANVRAQRAVAGKSLTTWTVTIVLPPRVMAGHPATLAVFGVDGRLAAGVTVTLERPEANDRPHRPRHVHRACDRRLFAGERFGRVGRGADRSGGRLERAERNPAPPVISLHDRFWVCTAGLRGDADADSVTNQWRSRRW